MTINGNLGRADGRLTDHNARLMHTYDLAGRTSARRGWRVNAHTVRWPTWLRFNLRGALQPSPVHYACNRGRQDQRELPSNEGQSKTCQLSSAGMHARDRTEEKLTSAGTNFNFTTMSREDSIYGQWLTLVPWLLQRNPGDERRGVDDFHVSRVSEELWREEFGWIWQLTGIVWIKLIVCRNSFKILWVKRCRQRCISSL